MDNQVTNKTSDNVTSRELYGAITEMRKEISTSILRLENKFDNLEAGRLTTLELQHASVKAELEPVKRVVYGLVATVLLAVLGVILRFFIGG